MTSSDDGSPQTIQAYRIQAPPPANARPATSRRSLLSRRIATIFTTVLRSPWYEALTALLVLFASIYASVVAEELRSAVRQLLLPPNDRSPVPASIWWLFAVVGVAALFLFFAARTTRLERSAELRKLEEQGNTLKELIRTQPPRDFLEAASVLYRKIEPLYQAALDVQANERNVQQVTERILRALAVLASKHDGRDGTTLYGTNVMVFHPSEGMPEADYLRFEGSVCFIESEATVHRMRGVLELLPRLSAQAGAEAETKAADDSLPERLLLAVPAHHEATQVRFGEREKRVRTLAGAPRAFVSRKADMIANAKDLRAWCEQYGDFTESVTAEFCNYFERAEGKAYQSFLAIPLFRPEDPMRRQDPFAVLNFHAGAPDLLKGDHPDVFEAFLALCEPFQIMLARLLLKLPDFARHADLAKPVSSVSS